MDSQNIKAFITVAHCGSFSEAAEQLYLTQSAISKRIAQLEHQVGKKLFDRFARQVSLTEAAQSCYPESNAYFRSMKTPCRPLATSPAKSAAPSDWPLATTWACIACPRY